MYQQNIPGPIEMNPDGTWSRELIDVTSMPRAKPKKEKRMSRLAQLEAQVAELMEQAERQRYYDMERTEYND